MGNTAGLLGPFFFLHSHGEYEGRKRVELQKSNSNTVHLFQESKKTKRVKWKGKLTPARHRCSADLAPCIHIPSLLSRTTGTLMWTWRFREVKGLTPNHTASRWWSWNSNLSPSEADPLCGRLPRSFRDRFANILIPISHPRRGPGQEGGGGGMRFKFGDSSYQGCACPPLGFLCGRENHLLTVTKALPRGHLGQKERRDRHARFFV